MTHVRPEPPDTHCEHGGVAGEQRKISALSPLTELKRKVEITKDARFQAHLRLERRHHISSYFISVLSLCVIALSLLPNVITLTAQEGQLLLAGSVILSVFIIILSLAEASQNFYHRGELLHENARQIGKIFNRLQLITEVDSDISTKLEKLSGDYDAIIDKCPMNHDNVDYWRAISKKPKLDKNYVNFGHARRVWFLFWVRVRVILSEYSWMFFPSAVVVAVLAVVGFFILQPHRPAVELQSGPEVQKLLKLNKGAANG